MKTALSGSGEIANQMDLRIATGDWILGPQTLLGPFSQTLAYSAPLCADVKRLKAIYLFKAQQMQAAAGKEFLKFKFQAQFHRNL